MNELPSNSDRNITSQQRREHPEPVEASEPIPWGMLLLAAALVVFSACYIAVSALDAPASWGDGREEGELSAKRDGPTGPDGASLYRNFCAACHQAQGQGIPGTFPPLAGSEWVNGRDTTMAAIVMQGVSGPLGVGNVTYDGVMPGFRDRLGDAEAAALFTFIRSQWGNTGGAVSKQAVATTRELHAARTTPFTWKKDLPDHE
ncbi:MAG: c-type cytochrome [Polaromonas sp.]|nr:c-type cytochrome [Polaromonas sp.]